jgi:hypothetical protein
VVNLQSGVNPCSPFGELFIPSNQEVFAKPDGVPVYASVGEHMRGIAFRNPIADAWCTKHIPLMRGKRIKNA